MVKACLLYLAASLASLALGYRRVQDNSQLAGCEQTCANAVVGAACRGSSWWRLSETCKCPKAHRISGDMPECRLARKAGRYFDPDVLAGKGCSCTDYTPQGNVEVVSEEDDIVEAKVKASDMTFDCKYAGLGETKGDVMFLHGFPEWNTMYENIMKKFARNGFRSIACNQRGYSLGASPMNASAYDYNFLRDDIFAVADATGFDKFHLVTHDHGSVLGWYAAGSDRGKERFLTFTGTSIPHTDAFSDGLFGAGADPEQQKKSQYFTMFVLPDSASRGAGLWNKIMGSTFGNFKDSDHFQRALWWYNGAFERGVLAGPPFMDEEKLKDDFVFKTLRWIFPDVPPLWKKKGVDGFPATARTGDILMPALYVCGSTDASILCNHEYALKTEQYCKGGYTYKEVKCGHDILSCGDEDATSEVEDAILAHVSSRR